MNNKIEQSLTVTLEEFTYLAHFYGSPVPPNEDMFIYIEIKLVAKSKSKVDFFISTTQYYSTEEKHGSLYQQVWA